jgi:Matrixin
MGRTPMDRALRALSVLVAVMAVLVVTLSPSLPVNRSSGARSPTDDVATQREAAAARTKGYAYLLRSPDHRYPARWCPGAIDYSVDTAQVQSAGMDPQEELIRWRQVFDEWSAQSGGRYTFRYSGPRPLGTKGEGQLDIDAIEPGSIGITYVHGDSTQGATGYHAAAVAGRTAGNGGLQVISMGPLEASAMVGDKGFVMIDVDDASRLPAEGLRRTLYQHESGHALGLGHVDAPDAIMNGTLSTTRLTVGSADRAGLLSLTQMPCEHP